MNAIAYRASPITDMEPLLHDLEAEIEVLGHVAQSRNQIGKGCLTLIESHLIDLHAGLKGLWDKAWEEQKGRKAAAALSPSASRATLDVEAPAASPTDDAELIALCDQLIDVMAHGGAVQREAHEGGRRAHGLRDGCLVR
jgi:hypothetical protein